MKRVAFVFCLLLVCGACGGKIDPIVDELPFEPSYKTAGYGAIGGMHVTLVDTSVVGETRTIQIQITQLDGTFDVASGSAKVSLVRVDASHATHRLSGERGSVTIAQSAGPAPRGSFGAVRVHIDLRFTDPDDDTHVLHVAGDYDAELTMVG